MCFVEYAKASPDDILILLTVHNRGSATQPLHLLPTLWFRNLWTGRPGAKPPAMTGNNDTITANHPQLGVWQLKCDGSPRLLFTENETNDRRLSGTAGGTAFVKDGINDFLLHGLDRRGQPGEHRYQGSRTLPARYPGRRLRNRAVAAAASRAGRSCL